SPVPSAPGAPFGHSTTVFVNPPGGFVTVGAGAVTEVEAVAAAGAHPTQKDAPRHMPARRRSCFIVPPAYTRPARPRSKKCDCDCSVQNSEAVPSDPLLLSPSGASPSRLPRCTKGFRGLTSKTALPRQRPLKPRPSNVV